MTLPHIRPVLLPAVIACSIIALAITACSQSIAPATTHSTPSSAPPAGAAAIASVPPTSTAPATVPSSPTPPAQPTPTATATPRPTAAPAPTPIPTATPIPTPTPSPLATVLGKFSGAARATVEGATLIITSSGIPDHSSPYFPRTDSRYTPYAGPNTAYRQNPNTVQTQTLVFRLPLVPQPAAALSATPLGPIGVCINGIPFYNQYAGPSQPLTNEINSFDQYNGHPQMSGQYHYHVEPLSVTAMHGRGALLGFLLDGYPVYGPQENGRILTSADLDQFHGHTHTTSEYPQGTYHYHFTADAPYLNGAGFYGVPGSFSPR
ncbi:MAG: YHYH protein [Dehalococcoidia bacterium]|nr:YHYH protein [Dehalococcoidia bacterium]